MWSAEAIAAIETADRQLARLLDQLATVQLLSASALVVASDHGFRAVTRQLHLGALLRAEGLVTLDESGRVTDYRAYALSNGGAAYVYLRESSDSDTAARVRTLFTTRAGVPGSGIARVFDTAQIRELGGDERALLALEAEHGAYFGAGYVEYETKPANAATHGYAPEHADMKASLLWLGPGLPRGVLRDTRLIDVAPTVARWLGVSLPNTDGRVIE